MKVVYTAPNRAHHYKYAAYLHHAGCLHTFVSGFPRISPRAKEKELEGKLVRADILQIFYILALKIKFPKRISRWLAYVAKIEQDLACRKFVKDCDVFLFYSGSGLTSCRYAKKRGAINIIEAVNSHVEYQEEILQQEYKNLNLSWEPFAEKEKSRRLREYSQADFILTPSEFVKKSFLAKGFPEKKLLKVPYGFNKSISNWRRETSADKNETFIVLYVGSISVRKGVRYLVEAFNKLDHPKKQLLLVGPNAQDGALNGVTLTPNILFTGVLKGLELDIAYKSAHVFCLPSIEEGLALVLGEALSFGLPIIATSNTGADEIITDGTEGYIVPIRDSQAIHSKLQLLADDREELKMLRNNSYARSANLNGWKETGKRLVQKLHEALGSNRGLQKSL